MSKVVKRTYSGAFYRAPSSLEVIQQGVFLFDDLQAGGRVAAANILPDTETKIRKLRLAMHSQCKLASLEVGYVKRENRQSLMSGIALQDFPGEVLYRSPVVIGSQKYSAACCGAGVASVTLQEPDTGINTFEEAGEALVITPPSWGATYAPLVVFFADGTGVTGRITQLDDATGINDTDTVITVDDASTIPGGSVIQFAGSTELMIVNASDNLTTLYVTRGYGSTTAQAQVDNDYIYVHSSEVAAALTAGGTAACVELTATTAETLADEIGAVIAAQPSPMHVDYTTVDAIIALIPTVAGNWTLTESFANKGNVITPFNLSGNVQVNAGGWSPERLIDVELEVPKGADIAARLVFDDDMYSVINGSDVYQVLGANLDIEVIHELD